MAKKRTFSGGLFLIDDCDAYLVFTPEDFTKEHKSVRNGDVID